MIEQVDPNTVTTKSEQCWVWDVAQKKYSGDSTLNEDHYAEYLLKNLKRSGERYQEAHYQDLFQRALGKIKSKKPLTICELGSGAGYFSCILSREDQISKVFSLEYSNALVQKVMPQTFSFMKCKKEKIQPICGSFNELKFKDNSMDMLAANCSLHHADNLKLVLSEANRVLKPGGYFFILERAHLDSITDEQIEGMLSKVKPAKKSWDMYGIKGKKVDRRMIGEHEYRIKEWIQSFTEANFNLNFFEFEAQSSFSNPKTVRVRTFLKRMSLINEFLIRVPILKHYLRSYRPLSVFLLQKNSGVN